MQEADEIAQAEVAVGEVQEENEELKEAIQKLHNNINNLTSQNSKYKEALRSLQERVSEINVSNARLLYTNRVLNDPSLNERQRNKIVEAISQCGSIEEAKVIYETLQGAVREAGSRRAPTSLSEAVTRDRSLLLPRRQQHSAPDVQAYERMKALAGIKK
jgi:chromosome segregation ATPase